MDEWNDRMNGKKEEKENVNFYFFADASSHASIILRLSIKTGGLKRVQRAFLGDV